MFVIVVGSKSFGPETMPLIAQSNAGVNNKLVMESIITIMVIILGGLKNPKMLRCLY
jgi:hypothetical protein